MHGRDNRGNLHEEIKCFFVTFDEDIFFSDDVFSFFLSGGRRESEVKYFIKILYFMGH